MCIFGQSFVGGIFMTNEDFHKIFHEIKNNITFISSSLQLIEKAHPEIKEYPYWNDSMQEISSLKRILTDLSTARLSSNLNKQKTSLEFFLSELIRYCQTALVSENFYYQMELEPGLPDLIIDPGRIKRALFNLVKNSFEAMDGQGTFRLNGFLSGSFIRLDLVDSGGGIPLEYLPKLFHPFETTKPEGTGLGLVIAKQIIESHSGRLTIASRPKDGCTFSVYLPYL